MKKFILTTLLLFIFIYTGFAQNTIKGSLSGVILDAKSNDPLPGANIIVVGTIMGTISDLEGNFQLTKIPAGQYTIKATMMGYKPQEKVISIIAQQTTTVNYELEQTVIKTPALVVTAGKKAQSFQDVPNSVSLVTTEDIERKNRNFLDEVLEYTPGVTVVEGDVNIRGSSGYTLGAGSRVLLLVDGIPMMPGDSGDIKWDIIPISQISRVEVVKGAGSALYGSHALGGVINIISKEPSEVPFTEVKLTTGVYDEPYYPEWDWTDDLLYYTRADVVHTRKWKKTGMMISAGHIKSTGYKQNTDYIKWNLLGRFDVKFSQQSQLTLQSNYVEGKAGDVYLWRNQHDALMVPVVSVNDRSNSYKFSFNTVYRQLINQKFTYKIRTSYFKSYWQHDYQDNDDFSDAQKLGIEIQADYMLNKQHSFTFGIEGIYDITESAIFGDHDGSTIAAYLQDEFHLSDLISTTLGMRFDHHKVDTGLEDTQFNPKLGFTIKPSLITTARASIGRGFRTPTMAELFSQTMTSGFKVIPNPDLKAERAWSYEVGLNQIINEHLLVDVAAFHNDYWNFIEPERDVQNVVQFSNVNRARIRGLEFLIQSSFWKRRIQSSVSYTMLDPEDVSTGKTLAYRPEHTLSLSFNLNLGNFETGLDYRYVSELDTVKVYPDEERVPQKVFDTRAAYHFGNYSISLNVNNIFNYNYAQVERNLAPIRNYVVSVSAKF